jgi:mono/diheme cytochrome c family protein
MRFLLLALALSACGQPSFSGPMKFGDRVVDVPTLERGQSLYNRYCATCHGYDGRADTAQARQLDPRPRDFTKADFKRTDRPGTLPSDAQLSKIISHGIPGTGMPAWPNIQGSELDALVQYLKTFSTQWQSPQDKPPENDVKGTMKALPVGRSTASFRAADGGFPIIADGDLSTLPATTHRTR